MIDQELKGLRPELREMYEREALLWDSHRPKAVEKLHQRGQRTARENLADLCDEGSFNEYGAFMLAARRTALSVEELRELAPADGVIVGTASINGDLFGADKSRCVVMSYDQSVMAGTQGPNGHKKTDRVFELAHKHRLPVVTFVGGGGGRPGDVDRPLWSSAGLKTATWARLGALSGIVPTVAIMSRYCFAGNAAVAGCCDIIIGTKDSSSGMGGPAMIEGGGMGVVEPQEVGPAAQQFANGVIDVLVENEEEAVAVAKKYLSYFQGPLPNWEAEDQEQLRTALPERARRSYEVARIIEILADKDSVLELRADFAKNIVTCLARIGGRPVGIIANNTRYQAGAIDSPAADKYARFMQLCNAHRIPLLNLIDCPGFMVGVEAEQHALVRHANRLYIIAAHLQVPHLCVCLRAVYGLGAMAMGFGDFDANVLFAAWPTARFGPMGDEGAVKLGHKKELDAAATPEEREAVFNRLMAERAEISSAINAAETLEVDTIIDPMATREWVLNALKEAYIPPKDYSGATYVDAW